MARGWESKSVEAQLEERDQKSTRTGPVSAEERARLTERRTLELMLARAQADLSAATVPAHRAMLERAIATLEEQLRVL